MTNLRVKKSLLKQLDYGDQARLGGEPPRSQYGDNLFTVFAKQRRYSHYGLYTEEDHDSQPVGNSHYYYKLTFFIGYNPEQDKFTLFPGNIETAEEMLFSVIRHRRDIEDEEDAEVNRKCDISKSLILYDDDTPFQNMHHHNHEEILDSFINFTFDLDTLNDEPHTGQNAETHDDLSRFLLAFDVERGDDWTHNMRRDLVMFKYINLPEQYASDLYTGMASSPYYTAFTPDAWTFADYYLTYGDDGRAYQSLLTLSEQHQDAAGILKCLKAASSEQILDYAMHFFGLESFSDLTKQAQALWTLKFLDNAKSNDPTSSAAIVVPDGWLAFRNRVVESYLGQSLAANSIDWPIQFSADHFEFLATTQLLNIAQPAQTHTTSTAMPSLFLEHHDSEQHPSKKPRTPL